MRSCSQNSVLITTIFLQSSGKGHSLYGKMYCDTITFNPVFMLNYCLIFQVEETFLKCCRTKADETVMERPVQRSRKNVFTVHVDIIGDEFWKEHQLIN
jgi:hypothetical protein